MSRGLDGLFRAMTESLYQPKPHVPDHIMAQLDRPMNGQDMMRLAAQVPPPPQVARVVDPKEMFK
jgi:hypothetical protein